MSSSNVVPFPVLAQSHVRLSPREMEIVSLVYMTNEDIAALLGISIHTVRATLRSAFIKLGVETRTQAYDAVTLRRAA